MVLLIVCIIIYITKFRAFFSDIGASYLGCFKDYENSIRDIAHLSNSILAIELCIEICSSKNFLYAGVQNG